MFESDNPFTDNLPMALERRVYDYTESMMKYLRECRVSCSFARFAKCLQTAC
jgi:hypothetical protein